MEHGGEGDKPTLLVVMGSHLPVLTWLPSLGSFGAPWASPNLASSWGSFSLQSAGLVPWGSSPLVCCLRVGCAVPASPSLPGPVVSGPGGWFGDSGCCLYSNISLGLSQA